MEKQQISLEIPFREEISRLFIFRSLWAIPLWFVTAVWSVWVGIISFLHFFYMLFLGKKHQWMWDQGRKFFIFLTRWQAYLSLLVDKKPDLIETNL